MEQPNLIDISVIHHRMPGAADKPLTGFFRSKPFREAKTSLLDDGYTEIQIVRRGKPAPGTIAVAKVHPLIALEYLRWVSYPLYKARVMAMMKPNADA